MEIFSQYIVVLSWIKNTVYLMFKLWLFSKDVYPREIRVFKPGQKLYFEVQTAFKMDKYHIRILDQSNNSRLTCYGKTSNKITLEWPIPKTINERHLGIWQLQFKSGSDSYSLFFYVK